ncbi:hypothetical protein [Leptospira idonii]|uniref:Uncharacterized protein n=1 Tax=Leptospira idonii TaxID=1193500 RepID=A0A4R9M199_9LEPT|nr:hypothetical protein [Leptospira idonii]TGN18508.1 hypothetical protein EHS15_14045 [Leptospira idonii]
MILTEKEPYENNAQTEVLWSHKKGQDGSVFEREKSKTTIVWENPVEIYADTLEFTDLSKEWKAKVQAMTSDKFHLHVESISQKNLILFSGIVWKKKGFFQRFNIF